MSSVIDVCNLALSHLGDEATVSSIDPPEGSPQAGHCARFYPMARTALLTRYTWSFSTRRENLALLTATPPNGWQYAYALPNGCLKPLAVLTPADATDAFFHSLIGRDIATLYTKGHPDNDHQQFTIEADSTGALVLYTNIENAVLIYVHDTTDTTRWTPLAILALARLLSTMLSGPLIKGTDGVEMAAAMMKMFLTIEYPDATRDDGQRRQQNVYADVTPSSVAARA